LDNQPCVSREGDEFEQFLQPPAFELLDRPLSGFKILEVTIDIEFGLKNMSRCSIVGWEDWARELDAWEVDGVVLGILEFVQDCRTGGG
jgi:hypothetical protein